MVSFTKNSQIILPKVRKNSVLFSIKIYNFSIMNIINKTTKRGMFIFQLMFILLNLNKGYNKKFLKKNEWKIIFNAIICVYIITYLLRQTISTN